MKVECKNRLICHYFKNLTFKYDLPIIRAAVMIIIFLIMYCPSSVGKNGFEFWNVISGKIKRGKNVPLICKKSKIMAIKVVLLNKKQIAIKTSQTPITCVQLSADKKGIQYTVSFTSCWAGERSIIYKKPNQKKIINIGILTKKSLVLKLYIGLIIKLNIN